MRALWGIPWLLFALPVVAQPTEPADLLPAVDLPAEEASAIETLSRAELNALGLDAEGSRVDTDFHFWGFADFTSSLLIKPRGAPAVAQGRHQTFYVGNLNTDKGRTVHSVIGGPVSNAASADTFSWIGYALAAYRFDWFGITPYLLMEAGNFTLANQSLPDARATMIGLRGGLNVSPMKPRRRSNTRSNVVRSTTPKRGWRSWCKA
jgi:hypothetical protein